MDNNYYYQLLQYLQQQILPANLDTKKQQQIIKQSKNYKLQQNLLYKIDKRKQNNLLKVIRQHELEALLYMFYNDPTAGYFSIDIMFDKIKSRYYWPQMYENIQEYVKSCDSCQRRGKYRRNEPLHPIPVHSPFYQIGIDFVGPLPRTKDGNKYIITVINYLMKWPEAKAILEATAE